MKKSTRSKRFADSSTLFVWIRICASSACIVCPFSDPVRWLYVIALLDDPVFGDKLKLCDGWPFAVTLCHDCMMNLWDDRVWWRCAVTLSDDHVWSWWMPFCDDPISWLFMLDLCDNLAWVVALNCASLLACVVCVTLMSLFLLPTLWLVTHFVVAHSLISNSLCFCPLDFTLKLMNLVLCQACRCILEFMHLAKYSLGPLDLHFLVDPTFMKKTEFDQSATKKVFKPHSAPWR